MIGRIHGHIIEKDAAQVLVDVGGIGYEIDIPLSTWTQLGAGGDAVTLHTHLAVREDAHQLFGFYSISERDLFRALIKVNGVGPRLALTILSGMDVSGLTQCIRSKDIKALTGVPGVGKKTAERLILDLQDRLPEVIGADGAPVPMKSANANLADAESALIGLGFKPQEASVALARIEDQDADVETLIKQALKALS